jgi:hypothetical protein
MFMRKIPNNKENTVLMSFWNFIKEPKYDVSFSKDRAKKKFWDVLKLWSVFLIVVFVVGIIVSIALFIYDYDMAEHAIFEFILDQPIYLFAFLALIWAPFFEEMIFRLGLKYSPFRFGFSIGFIFIFIFNTVNKYCGSCFEIFSSWYAGDQVILKLILQISIILLIGFGLGYLFKQKANQEKIKNFYQKKFIYIFFASAAIFSGMHLFNFIDVGKIWFLAPLIVLPQFALALMLGFVRMKYGLHWAVFNHVLHNAVLIAPIALLSFLSVDLEKLMLEPNALDPEKLSQKDLLIISVLEYGFIIFSIFILILFIDVIWKTIKKYI